MGAPAITVALAQINPVVGDLDGNAARILAQYEKAVAQGADLVVFPELCLTGYPPEDLILMPDFRRRAMEKVEELATKTKSAGLIIGCVWESPLPNPPPLSAGEGAVSSPLPEGGRVREGALLIGSEGAFNAAILMDAGRIIHIQPKTMLPNYGVFDEKRLFIAGAGPQAVQWRGVKLGLLVCEDMWYPELSAELKAQGAQLLVVINASPFEADKLKQRKEVAAEAVRRSGAPLIYVNTVGGQDDIVFDGGSFVLTPSPMRGESGAGVILQMAEFEVQLGLVTYTAGEVTPTLTLPPQGGGESMKREETLWCAMMMGLHDYVAKNGFPGIVLGLSGGIDSAISAAVAVDALGKDRVKGVLMSSPYTSPESVEDALHTAQLLGIETMQVPITPGMEMFENVLSPVFEQPRWMENVTLGGNVQARLRGMILMAISNRFGYMLLSTGNKSEISVGYSTLYGDSCGGYNVLKDLYKTQIYELANWRNAQGEVIPQRSITKAPSAELAPGQKDEDQLPPYHVLDHILMLHIEGRQPVEDIVAQGYDRALVVRVARLVRLSEYKRRQSCPGVKLSPMLFGKDRRYPLTNKF